MAKAKAFRINTGPICAAVTSTSAVIKAAVVRDASDAAVLVDQSPGFATARRVAATGSWVDPEKEYEDRVLTFQLSGLSPGTQYHYVLESKKSAKGGPYSLSTFPGRRQYGIVEIDYGAGGAPPTVRFRGRRGEEDGTTLADVEEVLTLEFNAAQTFSGF